jgi:hypothetical protein
MQQVMLRCDKTPDAEQTRYITIEAKKYQSRPVLSNLLPVMSPENTLHDDVSTDVDSQSTSAADSQSPEHNPESLQPELQTDAQLEIQSESSSESQPDAQLEIHSESSSESSSESQPESQLEIQPESQSDSPEIQPESQSDSPEIQAEKVGKPTPKPIKKSDLAHQSKPQQDAPEAKVESDSKPTPKPIKKGDLPPPPALEPQLETPTEQVAPAEISSTPKAKKIIGGVSKSQSQRSPSRDGAESGGGFNMATQRPPKAPKSQS